MCSARTVLKPPISCDPSLLAAARALTIVSRAQQGLPPTICDPVALGRIAALIQSWGPV
jgi:hypothetical protein